MVSHICTTTTPTEGAWDCRVLAVLDFSCAAHFSYSLLYGVEGDPFFPSKGEWRKAERCSSLGRTTKVPLKSPAKMKLSRGGLLVRVAPLPGGGRLGYCRCLRSNMWPGCQASSVRSSTEYLLPPYYHLRRTPEHHYILCSTEDANSTPYCPALSELLGPSGVKDEGVLVVCAR